MRLIIGSYTIDGTAASSTTTSASLRLDDERPMYGRGNRNEYRLNGFRIFVEAANEAALNTAVAALELQFRQISGKTITYQNTTGTALHTIDPTVWPECSAEYEIDWSDVNAVVILDIIATRPEPVSGGAADEPGQRGEIEWQWEIGPNGLTAAVATAEFGPSSGADPIDNAAAWVTKMYAGPPTGIPGFYSTRLRAVHCAPVAIQKPNQSTITDASYDPVGVSVMFREVYSGITSIPSLTTDLNVSVTMVEEEGQNERSGEADGPRIIVLSGYFTLITEAPTTFLSSATKVDRGAIYSKALAVYAQIEADFLNVYSRFTLRDLGEVDINAGLDSGRVTFSRAFSTTNIRRWNERTRIVNVQPVVINRELRGRDIVHHGQGGPIATLSHDLYIEALDGPVAYVPPPLGANWVNLDKSLDVAVSAKLKGGRLIHITEGQTNWRYANPAPRGPSDLASVAQGRVVTMDSIGDGTL